MKKKIIITLLAIVAIVCCALGLSACAKDSGDNYNGTYYLFEDEQYIEVEYYTLDGGNWSDAHNMGGTYEIKDGVISFYIDLFNQKTLWQQGTIGNGKLTIEGLSGKMVYYKKGMAHIHSFSGWKTLTDPDCTHSGEKMRACECGETERQSIPALGHDKTSDGIVYVPATCQNDGSINGICDRCGQQVNEIIDKDLNAHYIEEDKDETTCSGCGLKLADSLSFYEWGNNVEITNGNGVNIILPTVYHGKLVNSIGRIGDKNTISILIPDGVTSIDGDAFDYCTSLESITVDSDNTKYSSQDGILYGKDKTWIMYVPIAIKGTITLPNGIYSVREAFNNHINIENIYIPASVTSIAYNAFDGCTSLVSITVDPKNTEFSSDDGILYNKNKTKIIIVLPTKTSVNVIDSVTSIDVGAFYSCTSLESITVDPNNTEYSSQDGILYNKDKTKIITVLPTKTSVTIPDSVTSIDGAHFFGGDYIGAFSCCTSLESINIPDGVTSIGNYAFAYCTRLKSVNFGNNSKLETIGDSAFDGCTSLTGITIPDGVTSIGHEAFEDCISLTNVTIGDSVTSIGSLVFWRCGYLLSVTFTNKTGWKVSKNYDMSDAQDAPDLSDPAKNAKYFNTYGTYDYGTYYWFREG